jgi:hypothetical protein
VRPPRLAQWLLEQALPADAREHVLGDLAEVFGERRAARGVLHAWLWYWAQTLSFSVRFLWERISIAFRAFSWLDLKLGLRMLVKYRGSRRWAASRSRSRLGSARAGSSSRATTPTPTCRFRKGSGSWGS